MSSSLLLQQCPACLVRLTWIVFVMEGRWPYSWCLVGCCRQDCSILLAAFLCNCRLAYTPSVLLASMLCIDTAVWIRQQPGRNCVSFYLLDLCDCYVTLLEKHYECAKKSSGESKNIIWSNVYKEKIYLIYMYKDNLVLNKLQWFIRQWTKVNQTNIYINTYIYTYICLFVCVCVCVCIDLELRW